MRRFGIAVDRDEWRWTVVEIGSTVSVLRTGRVDPGDWTSLADAAKGCSSVGIALPDERVSVRRIRVGHPPSSSDALRQLVRWRLKNDLPFAAPVIDARMEGDHALVLAADRAHVESIESEASACGHVERVTSLGMAALGMLPRAATSLCLVARHFHLRASFDRNVLVSVQSYEGAPDAAAADQTRIDLRSGEGLPADVSWPADVPAADRGAALPAVGAVLGDDGLNLASSPPIPAPARRLAIGAALAMGVAAAVAIAVTFQLSTQLRSERRALGEIVMPLESATTLPLPELAALQAVAVPATPSWTSLLAELERSFPGGARLDAIDWRENRLRIAVTADDAKGLEDARVAISRIGVVRPISQSGGSGFVRAEFDAEPRR